MAFFRKNDIFISLITASSPDVRALPPLPDACLGCPGPAVFQLTHAPCSLNLIVPFNLLFPVHPIDTDILIF